MTEPDLIAEAYRHCEQLVRTQDKDRFVAALFAPAERRRFLLALYAFALEIARVKTVVREPMAGTIRLQWWIEALSGLRAEEAAASPVMMALQDAARQTGVSLAPLIAAVEARQDELRGEPPIGAVSAVFAMAAQMLGADATVIARAALDSGKAVSFIASDPTQARQSYSALLGELKSVPEGALAAFLPAALTPLLLRNPNAPQWRRQLEMLRAAWFGFPTL